MKRLDEYQTPETDRRTADMDDCCCIASDFAQSLERRLACAVEALEYYERQAGRTAINALAQIREGK